MKTNRLILIAMITLSAATSAATVLAQDPAPAREEAAPRGDDDRDDDEDSADAETDVRTEGGNKVKVFRFSGLDISGRLKSPQLLYFLNRLRAEFDRPKLPHRSFMPELQRSTKGRAL